MDSLINDICKVINQHSVENNSDTPDYILANYLIWCLSGFDAAVKARDKHYGITVFPKLTCELIKNKKRKKNDSKKTRNKKMR